VVETVATCVVPILRAQTSASLAFKAAMASAGTFPIAASLESDQPDAASGNNNVTSNLEISSSVTTNPPSSGGGGGGGGGGGAMSLWLLAALLSLSGYRTAARTWRG
jgi:hypothetical protein